MAPALKNSVVRLSVFLNVSSSELVIILLVGIIFWFLSTSQAVFKYAITTNF
jgi:hypothetical protein